MSDVVLAFIAGVMVGVLFVVIPVALYVWYSIRSIMRSL